MKKINNFTDQNQEINSKNCETNLTSYTEQNFQQNFTTNFIQNYQLGESEEKFAKIEITFHRIKNEYLKYKNIETYFKNNTFTQTDQIHITQVAEVKTFDKKTDEDHLIIQNIYKRKDNVFCLTVEDIQKKQKSILMQDFETTPDDNFIKEIVLRQKLNQKQNIFSTIPSYSQIYINKLFEKKLTLILEEHIHIPLAHYIDIRVKFNSQLDLLLIARDIVSEIQILHQHFGMIHGHINFKTIQISQNSQKFAQLSQLNLCQTLAGQDKKQPIELNNDHIFFNLNVFQRIQNKKTTQKQEDLLVLDYYSLGICLICMKFNIKIEKCNRAIIEYLISELINKIPSDIHMLDNMVVLILNLVAPQKLQQFQENFPQLNLFNNLLPLINLFINKEMQALQTKNFLVQAMHNINYKYVLQHETTPNQIAQNQQQMFKGKAYLNFFQPVKARKYLKKEFNFQKNITSQITNELIQVQNYIWLSHLIQGNLTSAYQENKIFQKFLQKNIVNSAEYLYEHLLSGELKFRMNKLEESLLDFSIGIDFYRQIQQIFSNNFDEIIRIYKTMALVSSMLGNSNKTINYNIQAIQLIENVQNKTENQNTVLLELLLSVSRHYQEINPEKACEYFDKSLKYSSQSEQLAQNLFEFAIFAKKYFMNVKASNYMQHSINIRQQQKNCSKEKNDKIIHQLVQLMKMQQIQDSVSDKNIDHDLKQAIKKILFPVKKDINRESQQQI